MPKWRCVGKLEQPLPSPAQPSPARASPAKEGEGKRSRSTSHRVSPIELPSSVSEARRLSGNRMTISMSARVRCPIHIRTILAMRSRAGTETFTRPAVPHPDLIPQARIFACCGARAGLTGCTEDRGTAARGRGA